MLAEQDALVGAFNEAAFAEALAGDDQSLLRAKREEAFRIYSELPVPTNRDEDWRKTGPELFPFGTMQPLDRFRQVEGSERHPWEGEFDVVVHVRAGNYSIEDRSGARQEGLVDVLPLHEAAERYPADVEQCLQGAAMPPSYGKFSALNAAFWNVGFFVKIPDGVTLPRGVFFRYEHDGQDTTLVPRLLVVAGKRSDAKLVEQYLSPDGVNLQSIAAKEFYVDEGGLLRIYSLQEWGDQTCLIDNDMAVVQRDARFDWITVNIGSKVSKMKFGSDVAGPGSSAELDGIFFAAQNQHLEQTTWQIHSSPDTYSRLLYKGAVQDKGRSVYRGIIQAKPKCIRVDAYQTNNNLVLSDGARADTIPGLLIDADDLKCSHGATIGNVDEEQVFYLRSRGLDDSEARKIVILGYFEEIVDRIPYPFLVDHILALLEEKLSPRA